MAALPPNRPSDFASQVPTGTDKLCGVLSKMTASLRQLSLLVAWMIKEDGEPTQDFLDWVGSTSTGLAAPTGLSATQDRLTDITVSWASSSGAISYDVYRGSSGDTAGMILLASGVSGTTYVDTGAATDTSVFYAVKALSSTSLSGFSSSVSGKRPSSSSGSDPVVEDFTPSESVPTKTIVVPTGKTTMEVQIWGAGGRGGARYVPAPWTPVSPSGTPNRPGGGGASGSFLRLTGVTVVPGNTYVLAPGLASTSLPAPENSYLYKDALYDSEAAFATAGGDGTAGTAASDGLPGSPSGSPGTNSLGSGATAAESAVGAAGSGTTPGAAIVYSTRSAGAGGAGSTVSGGGSVAGAPGRIRIVFT